MNDIHVSIKDIEFEGLNRTNEIYIRSFFNPVSSLVETNLATVGEELENISKKIESLGIFKKCHIILDRQDNDPTLLTIKTHCEESSPFQFKLSMEQHELGVTGILKNIVGYAEELRITGSRGYFSSLIGDASFSIPSVCASNYDLSSSLQLTGLDFTQNSSYRESDVGFTANLARGAHLFSWNTAWRDLVPSARYKPDELCDSSLPSPSREIYLGCKTSLISALSYSYRFSSLDHPFVPRSGFEFCFSTQLAGLGGDVNHFKTKFNSCFAFPITSLISARLSFSGGIIQPLGAYNRFLGRLLPPKTSLINDRFHLDSSLLIRGFSARTLGPRVSDDALGGDVIGSAGFSISSLFPWQPIRNFGVQLHTFANAGNLVPLSQQFSVPFRDFFKSARLSTGVGLVIPTPIGRIEANYCWLPRLFQSDRGRSGFHLGFDFSFS